MAKKSKNEQGKEKEVSKDVQIIQLKNQLVRALADYDNLRKRVENERSTFEKMIGVKIVARILPIFDMLEEAQKHLQDSGIALVLEEFKKTLNEEGIERIKADKETMFDENQHEVIEVKEGGKSGEIISEVLSGWKTMDGMVLRPAKVVVYK